MSYINSVVYNSCLWNTVGYGGSFSAFCLLCLENFYSQPQPKKGEKISLFMHCSWKKLWSKTINLKKNIYILLVLSQTSYNYHTASVERLSSYAINFHKQTSTINGKPRVVLATPLFWSIICPWYISQQRPLEAAHGFNLLNIGIHHTRDAYKYSTICGTAICSHGVYMKAPQLSHFRTICRSHLYPMDLELKHNVNGKA